MKHKIKLENGQQTEELLKFILEYFNDEQLDNIDIEREYEKSTGFAGEPLTTAAIISISGALGVAAIRMIERWFEAKRQKDQMILIVEGFKQSSETGEALTRLAEKNNAISVQYGLTKKTDLK